MSTTTTVLTFSAVRADSLRTVTRRQRGIPVESREQVTMLLEDGWTSSDVAELLGLDCKQVDRFGHYHGTRRARPGRPRAEDPALKRVRFLHHPVVDVRGAWRCDGCQEFDPIRRLSVRSLYPCPTVRAMRDGRHHQEAS